MIQGTTHFFTSQANELKEFENLVRKEAQVVITFHQNPDGDAFGSALGLRFFLENCGVEKVTLISPTEYAEYLTWMPGVEDILIYGNEETEGILASAEVIFCLDFSSVSRLKEMKDAVLASTAKKIMIDHHEQPEEFADLYYWNQHASSTCELVYSLVEDLGQTALIDKKSATCLYTGLLTDTGSFRFNSTTPKVHKIAAELIEKGVSPSEVHRSLFDNNPFEKVKFLGYVLGNKLVHLPELRVVYMSISEEELKNFNSRSGDTEGLVNYGLGIQNTVMSVLFTEKEGQIRISFRSVHDFSVADFAREHFDGGGHKNASGGRSKLSLNETVEKFLTLLPNVKSDLLRQPK
jgi:phosphoesterase RecJ-like protein